MKISFAEKASPKAGAVVVGVEEGKKLTPSAQELEKETGGAVSRAMKASKFTGKKGQSLHIAAPANIATVANVTWAIDIRPAPHRRAMSETKLLYPAALPHCFILAFYPARL